MISVMKDDACNQVCAGGATLAPRNFVEPRGIEGAQNLYQAIMLPTHEAFVLDPSLVNFPLEPVRPVRRLARETSVWRIG